MVETNNKKYFEAMYDNSIMNDMSHWHPILETTGIRMPETVLILLKETLSSERLCMDKEAWQTFLDEIKNLLVKATEKIGFPCFLRTGQASGKHEWNKSCYVPSMDELLQHLSRVIEYSAMADCMTGGLPVSSITVRKYIPLESAFLAFNGMPVAKERRYFVRDGKVECHHPYWIPEAIEFWRKEDEPTTFNWKMELGALNFESNGEVRKLTGKAERAGKALGGGFWSIDFAKGQDGKWYLIDCALGDCSYHMPHAEEV